VEISNRCTALENLDRVSGH